LSNFAEYQKCDII